MEPRQTSCTEPPARGGGAAQYILLALLYLAATALYTVLAHQSPIGLVQPDEITYGSLAQSVADGDGLTIRGLNVDLISALYIYLIAPAWKLSSGSDAYEIAQTIGAAVLCLTVFPVWLLARAYVGAWPALVPAVLVLSGSWMLTAAGLLTENLALPLSAAALAATVPAVSRPGSRWAWLALGFALIAALARVQLAILIPIILTAIGLDCARFRDGWRGRLVAHRSLAIASGALTLIGIVAVTLSPDSVLGMYEGINGAPKSNDFINGVKDQLTGLLAMAAVLPVVLVAAGSATPEAWRDERLAPLLAVTWAAVALFLAQSAWALTSFKGGELIHWHIQRYIEYALPLLLVTMTVVVVWRRVPLRALAISGAVATLVLLATPGVRNGTEERGLFGVQERVNSVLGTSAGVSLALVSALLVAASLLTVARLRERPVAALGVNGGLILAVFVMQAQVVWPWQDDATSSWRAGFPSDLSWVDHSVPGDVARMVLVSSPPRAAVTQLFNERIRSVYRPAAPIAGRPPGSRECTWAADESGLVTWGPACGDDHRRLLLDDDFAKLEFHDQTIVATQPGIGRLVEVPQEGARIRSALRLPCGPLLPVYARGGHSTIRPAERTCFSDLDGAFWLDRPGELILRFRGGKGPNTITFDNGARVEQIPARADKTVRLAIPEGAASFAAKLGWRGAGPDLPELVGAEIAEQDGTTTNLLY